MTTPGHGSDRLGEPPAVGTPVTLRHRVMAGVDEAMAGAGTADPVYADLVGTVVSVGAQRLVVRRAGGPEVSVRRDRVIALRVLPAPPRPARQPDRLLVERLAAAAWPAAENARLGDWLLRATGGWTRRANSALVIGSPGVPLPAALATCARWYATRGLRPLICVPLLPVVQRDPGAPDAARSGSPATAGSAVGVPPASAAPGGPAGSAFPVFAELGWVPESPTLVLTARIADVLAAVDTTGAALGDADETETDTDADAGPERGPDVPDGGARRIRVDGTAGAGWLRDYRGADRAPGAARVLAGPPAPARTRFATLLGGVADGGLAGRARAVTDRGWVGLTALGVAPSLRRSGFGRALTAVLLLDGLRNGGVRTYVQVERADAGAVAFWLRLGYQPSHEDVYLTLPVE